MTREEALDFLTGKVIEINIDSVSSLVVEVNRTINKIYDDFDADMKLAQKIIEKQGQTCESCKYNSDEGCSEIEQYINCSSDGSNYYFVEDTFSCNKWKKK